MKSKKLTFFFPLAHLNPALRMIIAVSPVLILLSLNPLMPPIAQKAPIVFYYPAMVLATWLGGSRAGIFCTAFSTVVIFTYIRPELLDHVIHDRVTTMRFLMFYLSTVTFLSIMWALERAVKKAEDALRLRDEFLSFASHELRTPVTAMKLNLEVAKEKLKDPTQSLLPNLDSLERQINRQDKLINSMLDLNLIESGQFGIRKEYCDLSTVVEKAALAAKDSLNEEQVALSLETLHGHWDKQRVEQAIFNLVHNALKYGEKNSVKVSLATSLQEAVIKVSNSGTIIPEEFHEQIFKKFERPLFPSKVQGLGIGLYLSRFMIELHDGELTLSGSSDKETVFTVKLPLTKR